MRNKKIRRNDVFSVYQELTKDLIVPPITEQLYKTANEDLGRFLEGPIDRTL